MNPSPRVSKGFVLRYQGQFEAALACFDEALAMNPNTGFALLGRSLALMSLERFAEAEKLVQQESRLRGMIAAIAGVLAPISHDLVKLVRKPATAA